MSEELARYLVNGVKADDSNEVLVRINAKKKGGALNYDPHEFNDYYINYINEKIANKDYYTDRNNQMQIVKCYNVLYLDCDWVFNTDESTYSEITEDLALRYLEKWKSVLKGQFIYFIFFPETHENQKGGFHIFIHTVDNIDIDDRMYLYNEVRKSFAEYVDKHYSEKLSIKAQIVTKYDTTLYETLFDTSPLKSAQSLLPFAQKDYDSRRYVLQPQSSPEIFDGKLEFLVSGTYHLPTNNNIHDIVIPKDNLLDNDFKSIDLDYYHLGKSGKLVAEFMESLRFLTKEHSFWKVLANNDSKLKKILSPLIRILCALYFIEKNGKMLDRNHFINLVTKIIRPLLELTVKPNEQTDRATQSSIMNHVERQYDKYSHVTRFFSPANCEVWNGRNKETELNKDVLKELLVEKLTKEKDERIANFNNEKKHKQTVIDKFNISEQKKLDSKLTKLFAKIDKAKSADVLEKIATDNGFTNEVINEGTNEFTDDDATIESIKRNLRTCFESWNVFVKDVIMNNMKDEIQAFDGKDNVRNNLEFKDVLRTLENDYHANNSPSRLFYENIIRRWAMMFMFVTLYESTQLTEAIRATITAFTRYFIWENKESATETLLYIYNVKQTFELEKYPYNQWICDIPEKQSGKASGVHTKSWFKNIYTSIIDEELRTSNKYNRLQILTKAAEQAIDCQLTKKLNPLADFNKGIDNMFDNIISSRAQERNVSPTEISIVNSNFFPMRNGLLEFDAIDGEVLFHTDNYRHYMKAHTNVIWDDNYDYSNPTAKRIDEMWKQIYPVEEERTYVLRLFSSVLHSSANKDQIPILYGGGSEGKSVICNAITAMLGSDGIGRTGLLVEGNRKYTIENPCGLASSMKTEAILVASKGGHDEGGVINLYNKRFCTVQEPNTEVSKNRFNCARLKELTSGSQVSGRNIFKGARSFIPNCLIPIQTNTILGYTEDTDAMRRRISVITHRTKFITEANKNKVRHLKYKFSADPKLNSNLCENPVYWQAVFYSLLPYAKELIKNKFLPISNIPKPSEIVKHTNGSFTSSNGLIGWFNQNIYESVNGVIHIRKLVNDVQIAHGDKPASGILSTRNDNEQQKEIHKQIEGTFSGAIFKLKPEFITQGRRKTVSDELIEMIMKEFASLETTVENNGETLVNDINEQSSVKNIDEPLVKDISEQSSTTSTNESSSVFFDDIKNKYFEHCAISNMSHSAIEGTHDDLFIIGYSD